MRILIADDSVVSRHLLEATLRKWGYEVVVATDGVEALSVLQGENPPRLAILEITQPRGRLKPFFGLWFDRIVPRLGRLLPGGAAYAYLPASVARFPPAEELAVLLGRAGFADVRFRLLAGSIVALHTGTAA